MTSLIRIGLILTALLISVNEFSAVAMAGCSIEIKTEIEPEAIHMIAVRKADKEHITAGAIHRFNKSLIALTCPSGHYRFEIFSTDRTILFRSFLI